MRYVVILQNNDSIEWVHSYKDVYKAIKAANDWLYKLHILGSFDYFCHGFHHWESASNKDGLKVTLMEESE